MQVDSCWGVKDQVFNLGAVGGKGIAKWLKSSPVEERSLIASGAAAGLAAAFNAPIAGLLFVVEEVYHHFSRFSGFPLWQLVS